MKGKLILIIGPSGSGKGTLIAHIRSVFPELVFPTSWVTRAPRVGELDNTSPSGKRYHFTTTEEFLKAESEGYFLESDFHFNNYYGTPAGEIQDALAAGKIVLHEFDIKGAKQTIEKIPRNQIKIIFISVASWEELSRRILTRQPMSEDELEKRRLRYAEEMEFAKQADFIVENKEGKLPQTEEKLDEIMRQIIAQ